jgi:hypothetical protein
LHPWLTRNIDHGGRSPQLLTLKCMEQYGGSRKSWQIEQATLQCDRFNIRPSETLTSTRGIFVFQTTTVLNSASLVQHYLLQQHAIAVEG